MNTALKSPVARLVMIAALACTGAAAHANGFTIGTADEHLVSVGMSQAEVMNALGRPSMNERFMNQPGVTWTYEVPDQTMQHTLFDVDFDTAGKVMSVSERVVDIN